MKLDVSKMDIESLDELIKKCEDAMVHPFKKKKEASVAIAIEPEPEQEEQEDKPDLSEMDMDDLLRMYEEMKASKE
jgi:hypothetical protein